MSELMRDDLVDYVIADGNVMSFACACGARLGVFHLDASRRELRVTLRQHVCVADSDARPKTPDAPTDPPTKPAE